MRLIFWNHISILGSTMASDREFRALLSTVAAGKLSPRIDKVFRLSQAAEAYRRMEEGQQYGKILLVPDSVESHWPDGD
jgi:D-arabinose 1-dehydrogenase-like Zn-dependent alcohol dehydrogenase